jgi:hypothetical protein
MDEGRFSSSLCYTMDVDSDSSDEEVITAYYYYRRNQKNRRCWVHPNFEKIFITDYSLLQEN